MLGNLHGIVEEQSRAFLAGRIGDSNVGEMFFARFSDNESALKAIKQIHELAAAAIQDEQACYSRDLHSRRSRRRPKRRFSAARAASDSGEGSISLPVPRRFSSIANGPVSP